MLTTEIAIRITTEKGFAILAKYENEKSALRSRIGNITINAIIVTTITRRLCRGAKKLPINEMEIIDNAEYEAIFA